MYTNFCITVFFWLWNLVSEIADDEPEPGVVPILKLLDSMIGYYPDYSKYMLR